MMSIFYATRSGHVHLVILYLISKTISTGRSNSNLDEILGISLVFTPRRVVTLCTTFARYHSFDSSGAHPRPTSSILISINLASYTSVVSNPRSQIRCPDQMPRDKELGVADIVGAAGVGVGATFLDGFVDVLSAPFVDGAPAVAFLL